MKSSLNLIKNCFGKLNSILKFVFNFQIKAFSDSLKIAKVTPLFRKGKTSKISNCRPI